MRTVRQETRIHYTPSPEVRAYFATEQKDGEKPSATINRLVERGMQSAFRFERPEAGYGEHSSASDLIVHARHKIILTGYSLAGLLKSGEPLLVEKAKSGINFEIVILKEDVQAADPLYLMLCRMLGAPESVESVLTQVRESTGKLRQVRTIARQNGGRFDLRATDQPPRYGLVIIDPQGSDARMRVTIYSELTAKTIHPFLDINPSDNDQGRPAFDTFHAYHQRLLVDAHEVR